MITVRVVRMTCARGTESTYRLVCDFVRMLHVVLKFVHFPWKIWRLKAKQKKRQSTPTKWDVLWCPDQIEGAVRLIDIAVCFPPVCKKGVQDKNIDKWRLEARGTYGRPLALTIIPPPHPETRRLNLTTLSVSVYRIFRVWIDLAAI